MKFKHIFLLFAAVMFFGTGCEKDRAFDEFKDLGKGALPRLTDGVNGEFDFLDQANSGINFTVEFYDENNGQNIQSYAWTVDYLGSGAIPIGTFDKGQFSNNADGLPSITISFTFQQMLDALGITSNDLVGGTFFDLQATLTRTDGASFNIANTGSNVINQAPFSGLFSIRGSLVNVPCKSDLAGTFDCVATATSQDAGIGWDGCAGNVYSSTVILKGEHDPTMFGNGIYTAFSIDENGDEVSDSSLGGFYTCYTGSRTDPGTLPLGDLKIIVDCGSMLYQGTSQWGEVYAFKSVTVDGATLLVAWDNDYGEGATARLSRTDGKDWPTDLKPG